MVLDMKNLFKSKLFLMALVFLMFITFILLTILFGFECPLYMNFHIKCPFCGGRKMIMSLFSLDFMAAFNSNQLLFVLIPITFLLLFIKYILKKDIKMNKWMYILLIIITFAFTVLRNII